MQELVNYFVDRLEATACRVEELLTERFSGVLQHVRSVVVRKKKRPRESVSDQLWWWQRQNDREDKDSKTCFASTATVGSCSASCGLKLSALRPNCAKTIFDEAS